VLRSDETVTGNRVEGGKRKTATTQHPWVWLSTLQAGVVNANVQMGHLRWKNEKDGWNDLTQNRMLKHRFLHACKHRVNTNKPRGRSGCGPHSLDALSRVCTVCGFHVAPLQVLLGLQTHVPGSGTKTLSLYAAESGADWSSGRVTLDPSYRCF